MDAAADTQAPPTSGGGMALVLKNVGWLAFHKGFVVVLGIVSTGWVARQLGPERNGVLATARALVAFFAVFASAVDGNVLTKRLIERPGSEDRIMGGTVAVLASLGLLSMGSLMVYVWLFSGLPATVQWTATVCGLCMLFTFQAPVGYWFQSKLMVRNMVLPNTAATLTLRLWQIGCAITGASVLMVVASDVVSVIVSLALVMALYHRCGQRFRNWRLDWREGFAVLVASSPLLVACCVLAPLYRLGLLMVRSYHGEATAGYYSVATTLTESLFFLNTMIATPLVPLLVKARKADVNRYHLSREAYARLSACLGWGCALGLSLGSGLAIRVVFGPAYAPSAGMLALQALMLVPFFLGEAAQAFLTLEELLPWLAFFRGVGLLFNVALNMLLIPRWGGQGAALAAIGGALAAYLLAPLLFRRTRHIGRVLIAAFFWPVPDLKNLPIR